MLGKDVANNLRNSKEKWGTGTLVRFWSWEFDRTTGKTRRVHHEPEYCVLGLKAHEAGVTDEQLEGLSNQAVFRSYSSTNVKELYLLNDNAGTKEELIATLESPKWRKHNFEVERFIERIKQFYASKDTQHPATGDGSQKAG